MNLPQYSINYTGSVPANSTGIVFNPNKMNIAIGSRFTKDVDGTPTDMVKVCITLTELISEDWYNQQVRSLDVPVSFLSCIDGFDTVEMKPSINIAVLNQILSAFKIQIV